MNNNVSKGGFSGSPPPGSLQAQMMGGPAAFSQTAAPHSASSFGRQQFPTSGMYGWYWPRPNKHWASVLGCPVRATVHSTLAMQTRSVGRALAQLTRSVCRTLAQRTRSVRRTLAQRTRSVRRTLAQRTRSVGRTLALCTQNASPPDPLWCSVSDKSEGKWTKLSYLGLFVCVCVCVCCVESIDVPWIPSETLL